MLEHTEEKLGGQQLPNENEKNQSQVRCVILTVVKHTHYCNAHMKRKKIKAKNSSGMLLSFCCISKRH
jgi:hypothetical protein